MKVIVSVVDAKGKKQTFSLREKPIIIGRSEKSHVIISDDMASGTHCSVALTNNTVSVEDMNSKNGIYLNGIKVIKQRLFLEDRIKIGDSYLYIEIDRLDPETIKKLKPKADQKRVQGELTLELETFRGQKKSGIIKLATAPASKMIDSSNIKEKVDQKEFVKRSKLYTSEAEFKINTSSSKLKLTLLNYLAMIIDILFSAVVSLLPYFVIRFFFSNLYNKIFPQNLNISLTEGNGLYLCLSIIVLFIIAFKVNRKLKKGSIGEKICGFD